MASRTVAVLEKHTLRLGGEGVLREGGACYLPEYTDAVIHFAAGRGGKGREPIHP